MFRQPDRLIRQKVTVSDMDSVKSRQKITGRKKDLDLLNLFRDLWNNLEPFRTQRARAFRFAYGDQWGDLVEFNGEIMTERQYLKRTGNVVLQTNQVQNKVETMGGVIDKQALEPICHAVDVDEQMFGKGVTDGVQSNCYRNRLDELYLDWIRELSLGGLAVAYESWDNTSGPDNSFDSWTTFVSPNLFIFDSQMDDSRFWDASRLGRQLKLDFGKVVARFAHSKEDYTMLQEIYHAQADKFLARGNVYMEHRKRDQVFNFMEDPDPSVCMVLEAWTKENRPIIRLVDKNTGTEEVIDADDAQYRRDVRMENERRRKEGLKMGWKEDEIPYIVGDGFGNKDERFALENEEYWYCRFLAPDGTILWEGESTLPDHSHPFTVRAIPMSEGKIQGFLYPEIDHNIIMNRAVILNDWLLRTNAKGVVVVPKAILGKTDPKEFARSWTSLDDMVFIDLKPGMENMMPKVFYGQAQTFDVAKYLDTFSRMGDKSTAITDAIQGKTPFAGASGSLYAQMANNSTTSIAPFLKKFQKFIEELHIKKMKNILTFYDTDRWRTIVGNIDGVFDNPNLNLSEINQIEYDLRVKESTETPVYREVAEQDAKDYLMNNIITMDEYMEISKRPWMEKLKQLRHANKDAQQAMSQAPMQQLSIPQQQNPSAM